MKKTLKLPLILAALIGIGCLGAAKIAASSTAATPAATPVVDIALHKALYTFKMVSATPGAGLDDVSGKLYFEQDSTCDAWTTEHRMTNVYQYAEAGSVTDTDRYTAFESKDGQQFSFNGDDQENGGDTIQLRGTIEKNPAGTAKAVYSRPEGTAYDLPAGYLLPTGHTMEIIRHARAGDHYFSAVMFDGTDADGPVEIGTFIGKKATPAELQKIADSNPKIDKALMTPDAWHVRLAVFPLKDTAESEPAYEMEMVLHDNGVVSYALIDYKAFIIEQDLAALEKIPAKKCD
jgi:hypothetical protein